MALTRYEALVASYASLQGFWKLNDRSGTTAVDTKGTQNGSYAGAPTLNAAGAVPGNAGVDFASASSQRVGIGHVAAWNVTNFHMGCWVKTTSVALGNVFDRDNGTVRAFQWRVSAAGKVEIVAFLGGTARTVTGATSVNDGNWHKIAASWDGTTLKVYVDGVVDGSTGFAGALGTGTLGPTIACRANITSFFNGRLTLVEYHNAALAAADELARYDLGKTSDGFKASGVAKPVKAGGPGVWAGKKLIEV